MSCHVLMLFSVPRRNRTCAPMPGPGPWLGSFPIFRLIFPLIFSNDSIYSSDGGFLKWGAPLNHPILMGFSIINDPFWDTPIYGNPPIFPLFWTNSSPTSTSWSRRDVTWRMIKQGTDSIGAEIQAGESVYFFQMYLSRSSKYLSFNSNTLTKICRYFEDLSFNLALSSLW